MSDSSPGQFNRLFSSIDLRGRTLRNRMVFGAHTANMALEGEPGIHSIGDCVAPRQAPYAFYEGRKLGLSL